MSLCFVTEEIEETVIMEAEVKKKHNEQRNILI